MTDPFDTEFEKYLSFEYDDGSEDEYEDYFWFVDPAKWGKFKWFDMMETVSKMPPNAGRGQRLWYKLYVMSQLATLCCPSCKEHALEYYKAHPISIDREAKDALSLFRWVYDMREFVNDRKGVPKNKRVPFAKACEFHRVVGSRGFVPVELPKKKKKPTPPAVAVRSVRAAPLPKVAPAPVKKASPAKAAFKFPAPKKAAAPAKAAAPKAAPKRTVTRIVLPPAKNTAERLGVILGAMNRARGVPLLTSR